MSKINLLDQDTIDKIAAGEVVERPASIVKELVENSVDAGSNAVTVEIKEGGISLIRVTDNGEGIEKEQVRQAFLRHATSKIEHIEDLLSIGSLGFRGEALSSISAVSQMELITKRQGDLMGVRYVIEGGQEKSFEQIGAPEGSTFLVRNIFYNTPARRKFLKSAVTEAGYINDLLEHLALSHPEISFKFINNGQVKLHTSGNHNLKDIIYSVYGREFAANLIAVKADDEDLKIEGFIGKPAVSRGNRNYENYFVNGRYVKSAIIARAIEDAYGNHMMQHRYPFTVLNIQLPGTLVDVNVHPTKQEVRFADGPAVYNKIMELLKNAIESKELIPEASVLSEKELRAKLIDEREKELKKQQNAPEPFEKIRKDLFARHDSPYEPRYDYVAEKKHTWTTAHVPGDGSLNHGDGSFGPTAGHGDGSFDPTADHGDGSFGPTNHGDGSSGPTGSHTSHVDGSIDPKYVSEQRPSVPDWDNKQRPSVPDWDNKQRPSVPNWDNKERPSVPEWDNKERPSVSEWDSKERPSVPVQHELFDDRLLSKENVQEHKIIGQVFDTFWIVQFRDQMYIIDQHAAHEKVMYERFVANMENKQQTSQQISPPVIISMNLQEEALYKKYEHFFTDAGFEIEPFGGREYAIRAVPDNMYGFTDRELFTQMLDSLDDVTGKPDPLFLYEKLASMACKAAVKGNNKLSIQEVNALIGELLQLENPYNCPHGRPTIISMSKYELEKKFKRIV